MTSSMVTEVCLVLGTGGRGGGWGREVFWNVLCIAYLTHGIVQIIICFGDLKQIVCAGFQELGECNVN